MRERGALSYQPVMLR